MGKWFLGTLLKVVRLSTILHITVFILLISASIGAVSQNPWVVYPTLLIFMTLAAAREPVFTEAVNRRIGSSQRATTLSNLAFISGLINVPIFLLAGHLALTDVQYPIWISVALIGLVIVFFSVKSEEVDLK